MLRNLALAVASRPDPVPGIGSAFAHRAWTGRSDFVSASIHQGFAPFGWPLSPEKRLTSTTHRVPPRSPHQSGPPSPAAAPGAEAGSRFSAHVAGAPPVALGNGSTYAAAQVQ